jgi:hypothetical protein
MPPNRGCGFAVEVAGARFWSCGFVVVVLEGADVEAAELVGSELTGSKVSGSSEPAGAAVAAPEEAGGSAVAGAGAVSAGAALIDGDEAADGRPAGDNREMNQKTSTATARPGATIATARPIFRLRSCCFRRGRTIVTWPAVGVLGGLANAAGVEGGTSRSVAEGSSVAATLGDRMTRPSVWSAGSGNDAGCDTGIANGSLATWRAAASAPMF